MSRRVKAELNVPRCGDAHRLLGIVRHLLRMNVDGAALRSKNLVLPAADLAPPLFPVLVEHGTSFLGVDQNRPRAPAVLDRQ